MLLFNPVTHNHKNQRGVGLLEVLVAVVVLAVGILALTKFQGSALRSGGDAKNRTIATSIAQAEMEQTRSFIDAAGYSAIPSSSTKTAPVTAGSNTTFTVDTTVTNYYFAGPTQAATTTVPTGASSNPDYKLVQVTVSWADETGNNQQVVLQSYINANTPSASGFTMAPNSSNRPSPSTTIATPSDTLPIDLTEGGTADGSQTSTTPVPTVNAASGTVEVGIETIEKNPSTNTVLGRDETRTINCVCRISRSDAQKGLSPATFDVGEDGFGDDRWIPGKEIEGKVVGRTADDNGPTDVGDDSLQLSKQPEICDICCRDHHDGGTDNPLKYDPFRPSADYVSVAGDHKHYFPDDEGILQQASADNALYLENCRFVRVDGLWRVVQDWRLESLQVLPQDLELTDYVAYVKQFIKDYILNIDSNYPETTPSPGGFDSDDIEINLTSEDKTKQLNARAIYIDYMGSDLLNRIKCKIDGSGSNCNDIDVDTQWLAEVPFYEVNVTKLADWTSDKLTIATVSSDPIQSDSSYSRGLVTGISGGTATITATMKRSNSGLTNTRAIDGDDQNTISDALGITVTDVIVNVGFKITGTYNIGNNVGISESALAITTNTDGATCQKDPNAKPKPTWICTLKEGDLAINITFGNYNYQGCGTGKDKKKVYNFDSQITVSSSSLSPAPTGDISNPGLPTETTTFALSDLPGDATLNIDISFVASTFVEENATICK